MHRRKSAVLSTELIVGHQDIRAIVKAEMPKAIQPSWDLQVRLASRNSDNVSDDQEQRKTTSPP